MAAYKELIHANSTMNGIRGHGARDSYKNLEAF